MRIRIFTDGACSGNPGPGGWASVIFLNEKVIEKCGYELETTNNRMELTAVIKTLEFIKEKGIKGRIEIYSDSAYIVNAINNGWIYNWIKNGWKNNAGDNVKNVDLWKKFVTSICKNKEDVKLIKVKGHSGNVHNERVDALAKNQSEKAKKILYSL